MYLGSLFPAWLSRRCSLLHCHVESVWMSKQSADSKGEDGHTKVLTLGRAMSVHFGRAELSFLMERLRFSFLVERCVHGHRSPSLMRAIFVRVVLLRCSGL